MTRTVTRGAERGMVLVSSLLLLLVVTIMAIAMFRSYGVQERIVGNVREKQRALHAAQVAEQYAEFWLTQDQNSELQPVDCTQLLNGNLGEGQICTKTPMLAGFSATQPPWQVGATTPTYVGVQYVPQGNALAMTISATPSWTAGNGLGVANVGSYFQKPTFYISYLGKDNDGLVFQIDAVAYGTTANAVAVIESTFAVGQKTKDLNAL